MECAICEKSAEGTRFCCPACARAALYPRRFKHAKLLLDRERVEKRAVAVIAGKPLVADPGKSLGTAEMDAAAARRVRYDHEVLGIRSSKERIEEIIRASESLRQKIESYKTEVAERRRNQAKRRQQQDAASSHLQSTHPRTLEHLKTQVRKSKQRHEAVYSDLIDGRIWLCHEAALIHALRRAPSPAPSSPSTVQVYTINNLPIPDLRDLPSLPPEGVTTALTQVCRLLSINTAYLGIRLPAEITLPGPNWPLPTIFPPSSSYQDHSATFPAPSRTNSPSHSTKIAPNPSRNTNAQNNSTPRPRPLFLDRPLPLLAREDPTTYALFIEGIALLAWNITWLSRTQGLDIAPKDWEEVCSLGRNMHLLFVEAPRSARKRWREREKTRAARTKLARDGGAAEPDVPPPEDTTPLFGHRSHSSSFAFLPSVSSVPASGVDVAAAGWRLANPQRIRDALRARLLADMQGAEWEVLERGDVKGMEESAVVLVGKGKMRGGGEGGGGGSGRVGARTGSIVVEEGENSGVEEEEIMARTAYAGGEGDDAASENQRDTDTEREREREREKRANGWTKVKSRAPT